MPANDPFSLKRSMFVLTDPDLPAREALGCAFAAIRGGTTHVVVRRPNDTPGMVYDMAAKLSSTSQQAGWRLLIHDRIDIALATDAHGAVLRLNGIPGGPAKERLLGEERMLGISIHTLAQARAAQLQKADFILFGNVYETESHPGKPGAGLEVLAYIVENTSIPVIAIGGITAERVHEVLAAGASGVAVIRAVSRAEDPEGAAREIRDALDAADNPHIH